MHLYYVLKKRSHCSLYTNHYPLVSQDLYQQHILDHYKRPRNCCEASNSAVCAQGNNASCGDSITFCIEYDEKFVKNATFRGQGCAISMAAASMLTEKLQTIPLENVKALTEQDIYIMLGVAVGPGREKCALLSYRALQDILNNNDTRA
jgi:nitrogen fixation NifU-like protein